MKTKKDSVLEEMFAEVDPEFAKKKKRIKVMPTKIEGGYASDPVPKPKAKRPLTQARRNLFAQLCYDKECADEGLRKARERVEKIRSRVESSLKDIGHPVEKDLVFFTEGTVALEKPPGKKGIVAAKGLLKFKETGDIDAEQVMDWARDNAPELLAIEKSKNLDLMLLQDEIEQGKIPTYIQEALKALLTFTSKNAKFIREIRDENLDLAAYEEAKSQGTIPQFLIDSAEKQTGHYAVSTWLLDRVPRCPICGKEKPKRKAKDAKFNCKYCGFNE